MTTENRDIWTDARAELVKDPRNAEALKKVESSIIVVALDDNKPVTREEVRHDRPHVMSLADYACPSRLGVPGSAMAAIASSTNIKVSHRCRRLLTELTSPSPVIVADNGRSAFNGEHSAMDGTPTSRLNDWMLRSLEAGKIDLGKSGSSDLPTPEQLVFNLSAASKSAIAEAQKHHQELMSKRQVSVLQYDGYGKDVIKQFKTSPDSWAQLTMQLAYYKLEGVLAPTYESAQTRKFKLGRTEVIRSATAEALEWCKAMEDASVSNSRRLELFKKAVAAHVKYAGWAADGQGVDRHLFGLSLSLEGSLFVF